MTGRPNPASPAAPAQHRHARTLLALLPPIVALFLQWMLWPIVQPSIWFLLYPAIFLSSWLGGWRISIAASAVSAVVVLWAFIPPERTFIIPAGQYLAASIFVATGVVFGVFNDRLRRANRRTVETLAATERANDALRQAIDERRVFTALIENSSDFIGIAEPTGKPIYLNPAGRRMMGLPPDHPVESMTILDCYSDDQRAFASDVILKAMVEKGHWQGETSFRHWQTGEAIPVSDTHFMIREPETDRLLGMGTVTRDISELKRARDEAETARQELQRANQALASLFEQAPDGIFVADLSGRYTDVNGAGCRLLGLSREEIVGKTIVDFIPAEDVDKLGREKERLLAGETVVSEWVLRRKDGTYVPVEVSAAILPDGRWQGFVRDISERKQLAEALRAQQADLERAQSVAKVGSWRLDIRRNELSWSEESHRIFGIPPGTPLTYETFLSCVHPDDRDLVDREWRAAVAGKPYDIEHRIVVAGQIKWVREKADLEFDDQRRLVGGIGITYDVTDRKLREEELHQVRERYELALRGADLGAWDWNIQTGAVVFNARWAEMRGYRPDELRGHVDSWSSGVHPDDWPRVQMLLGDYLAGRAPEYEAELRVRTKSGEWIWVLDRGRVFERGARGEPTRMVGTELDITGRKQAEERRRVAEAKASGIVSVSADAIISIDVEQRITLFNEGAEKIFGYTKAEALGAPLEMLIPERFRTVHRRDVDEFAAAGPSARKMGERGTPIVGRRKSGEEFPADAAISRLSIEGTQILTVALRDVSEQRRFESQQALLSEMGSVLSSSLEVGPTLASVARLTTRSLADACIVYAVEDNGEIRRTEVAIRDPAKAGIRGALSRRPVARAQAPEIWAELEANRSVLIAQVTPKMREAGDSEEDRRAMRALAAQSVIIAPLFAHGRLVGAMSLISCDPSRRYAPADVPFVEQIAQRAAFAIDNAQLYDETRRAVQSRDDVLGVVAHDLRNPLGAILVQAGLVRRAAPDPGHRTAAAAVSIERSAKRMNRLIQDLLEVVRLEQGGLVVQPARIPCVRAVEEAAAAQEMLASAASIDLTVDLPPDLPDVWADGDRLSQIFENLIGNALKFTEAGGLVRVGAAPRDGEVLFSVEDTGMGISAEHLPHVFDRFWQALKSERRGAGLGLPIVKGLVEAHGGRIWVESTVGRGTTFFFTIPAASRVAEPAAPTHHS